MTLISIVWIVPLQSVARISLREFKVTTEAYKFSVKIFV